MHIAKKSIESSASACVKRCYRTSIEVRYAQRFPGSYFFSKASVKMKIDWSRLISVERLF